MTAAERRMVDDWNAAHPNGPKMELKEKECEDAAGGYDPFAYGRSLGIEGLMGGPGFVYATSRGPIDEYYRRQYGGQW